MARCVKGAETPRGKQNSWTEGADRLESFCILSADLNSHHVVICPETVSIPLSALNCMNYLSDKLFQTHIFFLRLPLKGCRCLKIAVCWVRQNHSLAGDIWKTRRRTYCSFSLHLEVDYPLEETPKANSVSWNFPIKIWSHFGCRS